MRVLLIICRAIDLHVEQGHGVQAQFRKFAWRWRGAFYNCDPSRRMHLSAETLKRIYYRRWKRSGRNPDALRFRYGVNKPRFTLRPGQRRLLPALLRECHSFSALFRALYATAKRPPGHYVFRRAFTADERQFLRRVFAARRQERMAARRFNTWLRDPSRTFYAGGKP